MEALSTSAVTIAAVAVLLAAAIGIILAFVAVGGLRGGLRRTRAQIMELRRHPMVGSVPVGEVPAVDALNRSLNQLLDDLRQRAGESRARVRDLEALADGPPDLALIGVDPSWQVSHFNRGARNLTCWPQEEILGRHVEILFAPGEWDRLVPKLARHSMVADGLLETVRLQRRDGVIFPARLAVQRGGGEEDGPVGLLLTARDLSQEEALERRLRASEERYRRLVEEVRDGVLILREGRIAYANPALSRMLRIAPDELDRLPFKDLVHTRDLLPILENIRRAEAEPGTSGEALCRLSRADGPAIEARLTWIGNEFQGGRAVFVTVVDLTERARAERKLQESEARLRAALQASSDGILVLGNGGEGAAVLMANRSFCELFGISFGQLEGRSARDVDALMIERASSPDRLRECLSGIRAHPGSWREGLELSAPRRALVDLQAGPIHTAGGATFGWILTVRDVTERADGEQRLKQSLEDQSTTQRALERSFQDLNAARTTLEERNQQLEKLNRELRSLDEMKSNLLANVSHELHTPLVSIKGYTEMIVGRKLGPLTPEQERGLSVAMRNIDRLIEMIDNLLSFARLERGEAQLTITDFPLWQIVDEAIELVGERVTKKNISVTTTYEPDDLVVRGDRVKLGQVFTNLMTNAVKFNRDGGSITLVARRGEQGFVDIDITDSGVGIAPQETGRVFERFYQSDTGSGRRYEGTGIGLSIVRDILRLHGCSIRVSSEPGVGSTFSFTLPLAHPQSPSRTQVQARGSRTRIGS